MQPQPTLTGVTPELVVRAAAVTVGTPEDSVIQDRILGGRPPSDQRSLARRLATYSLCREHGYSMRTVAQAMNLAVSSVHLSVRHVETALEEGNSALAQHLTVMGRLVGAWTADPLPVGDAA